MASSTIPKEIKSVSKTISTDNVGNATLFSGQTKTVVGILCTNKVLSLVPFHGYGNTYAKVFTTGINTPAYALSVDNIDVTIYYL